MHFERHMPFKMNKITSPPPPQKKKKNKIKKKIKRYVCRPYLKFSDPLPETHLYFHLVYLELLKCNVQYRKAKLYQIMCMHPILFTFVKPEKTTINLKLRSGIIFSIILREVIPFLSFTRCRAISELKSAREKVLIKGHGQSLLTSTFDFKIGWLCVNVT